MVEAIWRYPLKSAQGESVRRAFFGPDGPAADRSWACISADGMVVSAKNPRRWGRLLQVIATLPTGSHGDVVQLQVPGSEPLIAGTAQADEVLSGWLGERVRLTSEVPPDARLHRLWPKEPGMIPEWADAARAGDDQITQISGARPGGRFVDFGAVHVVTTSGLAQLQREEATADVRRFRPNLVLSLEREPAPGDTIRVGPRSPCRSWSRHRAAPSPAPPSPAWRAALTCCAPSAGTASRYRAWAGPPASGPTPASAPLGPSR
jgi:uncharacterized protein YcbX